jgi:hypothetical protein
MGRKLTSNQEEQPVPGPLPYTAYRDRYRIPLTAYRLPLTAARSAIGCFAGSFSRHPARVAKLPPTITYFVRPQTVVPPRHPCLQ